MTEIGKHAPGLRGFPTPDIPAGSTSYLLFYFPSDEWAQYVLGATQLLTETWNWYKAGTLEPDEAAYEWHCIVEQAPLNTFPTCGLPGGGAVIGQDELGRWRMLDNGDWGEPSGDYAIPPLNPRTEPTDEQKRCAAAANAANVVEQLYEHLADEYAANHDEALFFLAIGAGIATLFLPPLGLLAGGFLATASILVAEGFTAFAFLTADLWDSEFTEQFMCILLDNATVEGDGSVTFDLNQVVNDVVNELAFNIDLLLAKQRLALQLGTILKYIGADGLNYAGSTTEIEDEDCFECLFWTRIEDFSIEQYDWTIATAAPWGDLGVYSPPFTERANIEGVGIGWATFCIITKFMSFDTESWCRVEIDYNYTPGVYEPPGNTGCNISFDGVNIYASTATGDQTAVIDLHTITGDGFFRIDMLLGLTDGVPMPGGSASISEIRWFGQGTAPEIGVEADPQPEKCDEI